MKNHLALAAFILSTVFVNQTLISQAAPYEEGITDLVGDLKRQLENPTLKKEAILEKVNEYPEVITLVFDDTSARSFMVAKLSALKVSKPKQGLYLGYAFLYGLDAIIKSSFAKGELSADSLKEGLNLFRDFWSWNGIDPELAPLKETKKWSGTLPRVWETLFPSRDAAALLKVLGSDIQRFRLWLTETEATLRTLDGGAADLFRDKANEALANAGEKNDELFILLAERTAIGEAVLRKRLDFKKYTKEGMSSFKALKLSMLNARLLEDCVLAFSRYGALPLAECEALAKLFGSFTAVKELQAEGLWKIAGNAFAKGQAQGMRARTFIFFSNVHAIAFPVTPMLPPFFSAISGVGSGMINEGLLGDGKTLSKEGKSLWSDFIAKDIASSGFGLGLGFFQSRIYPELASGLPSIGENKCGEDELGIFTRILLDAYGKSDSEPIVYHRLWSLALVAEKNAASLLGFLEKKLPRVSMPSLLEEGSVDFACRIFARAPADWSPGGNASFFLEKLILPFVEESVSYQKQNDSGFLLKIIEKKLSARELCDKVAEAPESLSRVLDKPSQRQRLYDFLGCFDAKIAVPSIIRIIGKKDIPALVVIEDTSTVSRPTDSLRGRFFGVQERNVEVTSRFDSASKTVVDGLVGVLGKVVERLIRTNPGEADITNCLNAIFEYRNIYSLKHDGKRLPLRDFYPVVYSFFPSSGDEGLLRKLSSRIIDTLEPAELIDVTFFIGSRNLIQVYRKYNDLYAEHKSSLFESRLPEEKIRFMNFQDVFNTYIMPGNPFVTKAVPGGQEERLDVEAVKEFVKFQRGSFEYAKDPGLVKQAAILLERLFFIESRAGSVTVDGKALALSLIGFFNTLMEKEPHRQILESLKVEGTTSGQILSLRNRIFSLLAKPLNIPFAIWKTDYRILYEQAETAFVADPGSAFRLNQLVFFVRMKLPSGVAASESMKLRPGTAVSILDSLNRMETLVLLEKSDLIRFFMEQAASDYSLLLKLLAMIQAKGLLLDKGSQWKPILEAVKVLYLDKFARRLYTPRNAGTPFVLFDSVDSGQVSLDAALGPNAAEQRNLLIAIERLVLSSWLIRGGRAESSERPFLEFHVDELLLSDNFDGDPCVLPPAEFLSGTLLDGRAQSITLLTALKNLLLSSIRFNQDLRDRSAHIKLASTITKGLLLFSRQDAINRAGGDDSLTVDFYRSLVGSLGAPFLSWCAIPADKGIEKFSSSVFVKSLHTAWIYSIINMPEGKADPVTIENFKLCVQYSNDLARKPDLAQQTQIAARFFGEVVQGLKKIAVLGKYVTVSGGESPDLMKVLEGKLSGADLIYMRLNPGWSYGIVNRDTVKPLIAWLEDNGGNLYRLLPFVRVFSETPMDTGSAIRDVKIAFSRNWFKVSGSAAALQVDGIVPLVVGQKILGRSADYTTIRLLTVRSAENSMEISAEGKTGNFNDPSLIANSLFAGEPEKYGSGPRTKFQHKSSDTSIFFLNENPEGALLVEDKLGNPLPYRFFSPDGTLEDRKVVILSGSGFPGTSADLFISTARQTFLPFPLAFKAQTGKKGSERFRYIASIDAAIAESQLNSDEFVLVVNSPVFKFYSITEIVQYREADGIIVEFETDAKVADAGFREFVICARKAFPSNGDYILDPRRTTLIGTVVSMKSRIVLDNAFDSLDTCYLLDNPLKNMDFCFPAIFPEGEGIVPGNRFIVGSTIYIRGPGERAFTLASMQGLSGLLVFKEGDGNGALADGGNSLLDDGRMGYQQSYNYFLEPAVISKIQAGLNGYLGIMPPEEADIAQKLNMLWKKYYGEAFSR